MHTTAQSQDKHQGRLFGTVPLRIVPRVRYQWVFVSLLSNLLAEGRGRGTLAGDSVITYLVEIGVLLTPPRGLVWTLEHTRFVAKQWQGK